MRTDLSDALEDLLEKLRLAGEPTALLGSSVLGGCCQCSLKAQLLPTTSLQGCQTLFMPKPLGWAEHAQVGLTCSLSASAAAEKWRACPHW